MEQDAVLAFLSDPATHGADKVDRISTHCAHVFLAGDKAFKLKRAVKFPFLDFSSIDKRHVALEAELAINKPVAPGLYRDVIPIYATKDGRLTFLDTGIVADWVLVMARFQQDALLDSLARRHALDLGLMDTLAENVASMHGQAVAVRREEGMIFAQTALENIRSLRESVLDKAALHDLEGRLAAACADHKGHLDQRAKDGFVRRCHGDLHLRNIVLLNGRPVPFDALEFDPELATGDIYYDLAFLLMDLEHRELHSHANRVLNGYVRITDDLEGLAALPLFLAARAVVRAKVSMLTADTVTGDSRTSLIQEAASYVDLAAKYLAPSQPCLIALGGLSGTGKSTVARELAPQILPGPGALIFRSDVIRKQLHGKAETDRLGPHAYTPEASASVYDKLMHMATRTLKAGYSVIVDAVFAREDERAAIEARAKELSAPFVGIWLDAPLSVRLERISGRSRDASDATLSVAERQEQCEIGNMAWVKVAAVGPAADVGRRACEAVPHSMRRASH